jgi:hypothetical protein
MYKAWVQSSNPKSKKKNLKTTLKGKYGQTSLRRKEKNQRNVVHFLVVLGSEFRTLYLPCRCLPLEPCPLLFSLFFKKDLTFMPEPACTLILPSNWNDRPVPPCPAFIGLSNFPYRCDHHTWLNFDLVYKVSEANKVQGFRMTV